MEQEKKRGRGRPKKIITAGAAAMPAEPPVQAAMPAEPPVQAAMPAEPPVQAVRKRGRPPKVKKVMCNPASVGRPSATANGTSDRDLGSSTLPSFSSSSSSSSGIMRARDYGLVFRGKPGHLNCITDVPGVSVGYSTVSSRDEQVNTGLTVIFPRGRDKPCSPCAAGIHSLNGNGELTGSHFIEECGAIHSPILLTNTASVGNVHRGIINWINQVHPAAGGEWVLPVVAETYDGWLSNIRLDILDGDDVAQACNSAGEGCTIAEGNVGGGTGMITYDYKGGSGSASRRVKYKGSSKGPDLSYHVGVFVQSNFGKRKELTIGGVHLGERLSADNPRREAATEKEGSIIAVVATDAPLLPHQCKALARRVSFGVARTGTTGSHFSGDIFIAFSTANEGAYTSAVQPRATFLEEASFLPWGSMDPLLEAVVEATEEAIINALVAGEEMVGFKGRRIPELPIAKVVSILKEHKAI